MFPLLSVNLNISANKDTTSSWGRGGQSNWSSSNSMTLELQHHNQILLLNYDVAHTDITMRISIIVALNKHLKGKWSVGKIKCAFLLFAILILFYFYFFNLNDYSLSKNGLKKFNFLLSTNFNCLVRTSPSLNKTLIWIKHQWGC